MTNKEAIDILWRYDVNFEPHPAEDVMQAIDMAIEALNHSEIPNSSGKDTNVPSNDCISRKDFDKCLEYAEKEAVRNRKHVFASVLNTIRGNLRNFPSAQPEITLESAIGYLHSIGWMQEHDRILTESAQPERPEWYDESYSGEYVKEEDVLKFYYVESLDDYWIGRRLDNFYYATWDDELKNFVWSKSRYLPWGEHVVDNTTLWKEHTYPTEPKEIAFVDWLKGFFKKYFVQPERKRGKWIKNPEYVGDDVSGFIDNHFNCSECGEEACINSWGFYVLSDFCPNCGADMRGEQE